MEPRLGGGSIRDHMALTGHNATAINIIHYRAPDLGGTRKMLDRSAVSRRSMACGCRHDVASIGQHVA